MSLPITFLLGAAVLLLHDYFGDGLPRAPHLDRTLPFLLLVPVPWLLLRWLAAKTLDRRAGSIASRRLRLLVGLLPLSVPAAYAAMVLGGDLVGATTMLAGESSVAFLALALLPLLVMEVTYKVAERRLAARAAHQGLALFAPGQLALVWLVLVPILLMAALSDLTRTDRWLHVFATVTALGHLCSFLVTVLLMCVTLPLLFRVLLPTSRQLPAALAADLRDTAQALGFPPRAVLSLRTDLRVANAAMVGPLPWPRYLVLTDALMVLLDPFALRGVVAHEIGHARARHPGLLLLVFVATPVLCFHTAWLWFHDADTETLVVAAVVAVVAAFLLLRGIAHRFEYEADQLSAAALGGAGPCIEALRRVGQLWVRGHERSTLRHPSDRQRIEQLRRWEADPEERRRFARAGQRLRWSIAGLVLLAGVASVWAQVRLWPIDQAQLAFYTGAFPVAKERLAALEGRSQAPLDRMVDELAGEVDAALSLVPEGGSWSRVRGELATGGLERGLQLARSGDPAAAVPWLSLSLSGPRPEPWRQTLYLLAVAAKEGSTTDVARLASHLDSLGPPESVLAAAEAIQAAAGPPERR